MKKIISFITRQTIFNQIIESKTFKQQSLIIAVQQYSSYDYQKKQTTLYSIFCTFKKQHSTRTILNTLILVDYLYSLQPEITLFNTAQQPKINHKYHIKNNQLLTEKLIVAEGQLIKFYFDFLKKNSLKTRKQINFMNCELIEQIDYCEISINQIIELVKIEFILNFLIKNSPLVNLIKIALTSIFHKVSFDLKILNKFVQKSLKLIRQKHLQSFRINQIYEKLLYVNSNLLKMNHIAKHLNKKITFQSYKIDTQLNKSIQIDLHEREQEKREYFLSTRKRIQFLDQKEKCQNEQNNDKDNQLQNVQADTMLRFNDFI